MARPERKNADYFPFYAKDGRTLFLLESKYGCKGTGFFTNVMRFLTLETHHHVNIQDETDRLYFFSKCHCDEESGMKMLDIMSRTGKINKELWGLRVIASPDLLTSLADAYRNRKNNIITIDEILVSYVGNSQGDGVSYAGNPQEDDISSGEKPQSKVNKSKVNKSNNNIPEETSPFDLKKSLSRYTDQQLIEDTIAAFTTTRKTGKISPSIVEAQFAKWERYPVAQVEGAMRQYLDKDCAGDGKNENYLCGIIRNHKCKPKPGGNHGGFSDKVYTGTPEEQIGWLNDKDPELSETRPV